MFLLRITPAVYVEEFELEYRSLKAIDSVLSQGISPDNSDFAIGFSEDGLSHALTALRGVSATTEVAEL